MSDRPDWLPEQPEKPSRPALPLWRNAVSLGLVAVAIMTIAAIFVLGGMIFNQPNYRPGDLSEKMHRFGFASLILCAFAAILGVTAYSLRRKPRERTL